MSNITAAFKSAFKIEDYRVKLAYNVITGTEYFVSLQTCVVITEERNVMVNSDELISTTEYLTL
jgi:hypothetical protein